MEKSEDKKSKKRKRADVIAEDVAAKKKKKKKSLSSVAGNAAEIVNSIHSDEKNGGEPDVEKNNSDGTTDKIETLSAAEPTSAAEDRSFKSLEGTVSEGSLKAITALGFTHMTEIQARCIPELLKLRDVMGTARTGQGKTLAFLVPVIELIRKLGFKQRNGTGAIVISPTRELAEQTYGVLRELLQFHANTCGIVHGGTDRKAEAKKLTVGINILVATPGRLLDHLQNTSDFMVKNLKCLVIDEADRLMQDNFEEDIVKILRLLPSKRQVAMFSATLTPKTEGLAKMSLKNPVYIGVDDQQENATVEGLQQGFIVCSSERRFLVLFTFLKKNREKKIMVFFNSCNVVKFFYDLLNYIDLPVKSIHGKQKQAKRTQTFFQFCNAEKGVLLCTDVAARGLDIPAVDWIVQYDPPDDPKEYIHRVGRTARGAGASGRALLLLRPEEHSFVYYLQKAKVPMTEYEISSSKVSNIQPQLEKLISENYHLSTCAKEAYKGYIRSYASHSLKEIFDVQSLDLQKVGKSFGFNVPPFVDLNVFSSRSADKRRQKKTSYGYSGPGTERKTKFFKHVKSQKKRK